MKYLYLFLLLLPIKVFANSTQDIDSILDNNQQTSFAIQVLDLNSKKEIYAHHPYQRMIPASTTKSFTAYAALKYLGHDFTYQTSILAKKDHIKNSVLNGDLYFKFTGDPSLKITDLRELIANLKLKKITEKIIIDDTIFDQGYFAAGVSWDDHKFCYSAPLSAIIVEKNCFNSILEPAEYKDQIAKITSAKDVFAVINNKIITKQDNACNPELTSYPNNSYDLTGCLDIKNKPISLNIAYQDPRLMIKKIISSLLKEADVAWNEQIIFATIPQNIDIITQHNSLNLSELVTNMHQDSDNIAANSIAKTIAAHYYKKQGNFINATKAIEEILTKEAKIDFKRIRMFDGSGQSRYNLIAPADFIHLFSAAYDNKKIWTYFQQSLSILGHNGTLKESFLEFPHLHGKIYAKTGSMSDILSLVGYIFKDNGQILVFAIMANNYVGSRSDLNDIIAKILAILA